MKSPRGKLLALAALLALALLTPRPAPAAELARLDLASPAKLGTLIQGGKGEIEVTAQGPSTVCLGVVETPGVEDCLLVYRARLRSQGLEGQAYLEMWCVMPDGKSYFSRGPQRPLGGDAGWRELDITFLLQEGQRPQRVALGLVVAGRGKVWVKDARLEREPRP